MSIYKNIFPKKNVRVSSIIKIFLSLFLIATIIFPILAMSSNMTRANLYDILHSSQFRPALLHSLSVAITATVIAIIIAYIFALCVVRTNMRFREVAAVFVTLPMLIPSISHGMGMILLLGAGGVLTRIFNLHHSIYGFTGIVMGSVLYAFPIAFLMLQDILKYEDESPYEAACVLGIPKANRFFSITLAYLKKPLISVIFATFTLIFTDYGVALMVGARYTTLPVLMYQEVIGLLHFGRGAVLASILLIPAVIAFLFDLFNRDVSNQSFVIQPRIKKENTIRDTLAFLYCVLICILITLPIAVFALITFVNRYPIDMSFSLNNITKTLNLGASFYILNSLLISIGVSALGTILSYFIAYFTARTGGKTSRFLHLVSITSLAIPGMALGLSYILFFKGSFLYGTLAMLILVNTVHFLASPYLMAYNSLCKLNGNLEDVGCTLGVSRLHIIVDVLIPQTKYTIIEMISYFFVNSMMTISAVSFLSTVHNKPVSLMITQFESQLFLEGAAFVSLLILICNFAVKILVYFFKKRFYEV